MKNAFHYLIITGFLLCTASWAAPSLLVTGGVNLSSTSDKDSLPVSNSGRQGWNAALLFEGNFVPSFSLITGIGIETRGEKESKTELLGRHTQNTESKVNMLYLQIPLLAQYNLGFGSIKLNVFAGPELGYLLTAKEFTRQKTTMVTDAGTTFLNNKDTTDFSISLSTLDAGLTIGAGVEYQITKLISLAFRPSYYYGLLDYKDKAWAKNNNKNAEGKHTNIKAAACLKFNFRE